MRLLLKQKSIVQIGILCAFTIATSASGETTADAVQASRLDPANTHAVIVGVLDWEQDSLTSYAKEDRQDVALFQQLHSMGVPKENMTLLLDEKATRAAVDQAVKKTASEAKPDSTLIIYYAGHGMRSQSGGVFACYDIRTKTMEDTGWTLADLEKNVRENFHGGQVLMFADCCFSGLLANVARSLNDSGTPAASLTSASTVNTSTNNWTYTVSLIDLLKGQPLADSNGDDKISLVEAAYDVRKTMLHYESQRNGFSLHGMSRHFVLADQRPDTHSTKASEFNKQYRVAPGDFVLARRKGSWRSGRLLDERPGEFQIQFQDYSSRIDVWVPAESVEIKKPVPLKPLLPPEPMPAKEALAKATMDGKYSELLAKIKVESDFFQYGEFHTFGRWNGNTYAGHMNLPGGYWVYVFPNWYIWKNIREPLAFKKKPAVEKDWDSIEALQLQIQASEARQKARESVLNSYQAIIDRTKQDIEDEKEVRKQLRAKLDALK